MKAYTAKASRCRRNGNNMEMKDWMRNEGSFQGRERREMATRDEGGNCASRHESKRERGQHMGNFQGQK